MCLIAFGGNRLCICPADLENMAMIQAPSTVADMIGRKHPCKGHSPIRHVVPVNADLSYFEERRRQCER